MMRSRTVWAAAIIAPVAWLVDQIADWSRASLADGHDLMVAHLICLGSATVTIACGVVAAIYLRSASPIDTRMKFFARSAVWLSVASSILVIVTEL